MRRTYAQALESNVALSRPDSLQGAPNRASVQAVGRGFSGGRGGRGRAAQRGSRANRYTRQTIAIPGRPNLPNTVHHSEFDGLHQQAVAQAQETLGHLFQNVGGGVCNEPFVLRSRPEGAMQTSSLQHFIDVVRQRHDQHQADRALLDATLLNDVDQSSVDESQLARPNELMRFPSTYLSTGRSQMRQLSSQQQPQNVTPAWGRRERPDTNQSSKIKMEQFACPITQEVMSDPVIAADGFSYEREAIQYWFDSGNRTSPMTNMPLSNLRLTSNQTLRNLIRAACDDCDACRS